MWKRCVYGKWRGRGSCGSLWRAHHFTSTFRSVTAHLVLFLISDLNFDPTTLSFAHPCSPPRSLEPYQPPDPPTRPSGHLNRMESGSRLYQEVLMKPVVNPKRFAHALRS